MDRSLIRHNASIKLKKNFLKTILVAFVASIIISGGYKYSLNLATKNISFIDAIHDFIFAQPLERGIVGPLIKDISANSMINGTIYTINNIITSKNINMTFLYIVSFTLALIFHVFVQNVVKVGQKRYFIEDGNNARIDRLIYPYQIKKTIHIAYIMLVKDIRTILWGLTIVYLPIKHYEYKLIPYLLATNPDMSLKEVFAESKRLSDNHKWEMFMVDFEMIGYYILDIITLGLFSMFYFNAYRELVYTELYKTLSPDYETIYLESKHIRKLDYDKNYSFKTYILIFFTLAIFGWVWEVLFILIQTGDFANRGTMYGPVVPIYGYGVVSILFLLKPLRKKPISLFIVTMILCGIIEYYTALYLERTTGMRYWEYDGYFLNIHGRTCLDALLFFAFGGMACTYLVAPVLDNLYSKIPSKIATIICIVLISLYGIDLICTHIRPHSGPGITAEIST